MRELKGVCSSSDIFNAFNVLESKLGHELQNIQKLLQNLQQQFATLNSIEQNFNGSFGEPITSAGNSYIATTPSSSFKFQPIPSDNRQATINNLNKKTYLIPKLKSFPSRDDNTKTPINQRQKEVSKFNSTVATNKDVKLYTYYWRVENCTRSLKSSKSSSMESPIFYIRGKRHQAINNFEERGSQNVNLFIQAKLLKSKLTSNTYVVTIFIFN